MEPTGNALVDFAIVRGHPSCVSDQHPPQPPEGRLIQAAMEAMGLSARKTAVLAAMSSARWRHIVNGYQPLGRGEWIPITAPAATLARMARVVGVDADQLRDAGRADAAEELGRLRDEPPPVVVEPSNADAIIAAILEVLRSKISDYLKIRTIEGIIQVDYRPPQQPPSAQPTGGDEHRLAAS